MNVTMYYKCGECLGETNFSSTITIGSNATDVTCSHCGDRCHISFTVLSLEPFTAVDVEMKRLYGVIRDGAFFSKGQLS